mmetsp:Transcript_788/g.1680  ORF Transcript_788/g.1680 Transcript_788/m.1680 type:complete len:200 (-) Transcript_788:2850-3449(-)
MVGDAEESLFGGREVVCSALVLQDEEHAAKCAHRGLIENWVSLQGTKMVAHKPFGQHELQSSLVPKKLLQLQLQHRLGVEQRRRRLSLHLQPLGVHALELAHVEPLQVLRHFADAGGDRLLEADDASLQFIGSDALERGERVEASLVQKHRERAVAALRAGGVREGGVQDGRHHLPHAARVTDQDGAGGVGCFQVVHGG